MRVGCDWYDPCDVCFCGHASIMQVLSLNPAQLTKEKVSVLLRMAPNAADQEALNEFEGDK